MTPDILPLLAASLACCSVLALFARHNQRTGWVKPRRLSIDDLVALEKSWKQYPAPIRSQISGSIATAMVTGQTVRGVQNPGNLDRTDFTLQLANFQKSLAIAATTPVEDRVTA